MIKRRVVSRGVSRANSRFRPENHIWSPLDLNPLVLLDSASTPRNLFPNSIGFDASYYEISSFETTHATVSAGPVGPDGHGTISVTPTGSYGGLSLTLPLMPEGTVLYLSVLTKRVNGANPIQCGAFRFERDSGAVVVAVDSEPTSDWSRVTVTATVPVGTNQIRVFLGQDKALSGYGTVLFAQPQVTVGSLKPYYPTIDLNEQQTWRDRSGHGNDAMLGSTTGVDAQDPAWLFNGLLFDGIDDYSLLPLVNDWSKPWTICVISRPTDVSTYRCFVSLYGGVRKSSSAMVDGYGNLYIDANYQGSPTIAPSSYLLNNTIMLTMTYDGAGKVSLIAGRNDHVGSLILDPGAMDGEKQLYIGTARVGDAAFKGTTSLTAIFPGDQTSNIPLIHSYYKSTLSKIGVTLQ